MKNPRISLLRGLTVQLFMVTVLPLTLLLLVIAFGSYFLHQQDMRTLVGERDTRGVQSAAAALTAELHHRASNIAYLVVLAELSNPSDTIMATEDLASDFSGGLAYLTSDGRVLSSTGAAGLWETALQNKVRLASFSNSTDATPVFSDAFLDPKTNQLFVIVSAYSAAKHDCGRCFFYGSSGGPGSFLLLSSR